MPGAAFSVRGGAGEAADINALKKRGDKAVIHRLRAKPSNQRIAKTVEEEAIQILSADRFGELVQWDTSERDWLEGRGEKLYPIAMIDDAPAPAI